MYDLAYDLPSRFIMSQPAVLRPAAGGWTSSASVLTSNAATAPDGTATASTVAANSGTEALALDAAFSMTAGVGYALSAYISSASGPWAIMGFIDAGTNFGCAWFDPNAGTVGSNSAGGTGAFVSKAAAAAAGGYFLATVTIKLSATNAAMTPFIGCVNANGAFVATNAQVIKVWHPVVQPLT